MKRKRSRKKIILFILLAVALILAAVGWYALSRRAQSLTLDTSDIAAWQPGDIVVYAPSHIAVVSDKRNSQGSPWIIHNAGLPTYEMDTLAWGEITGHFRWMPQQ